MHSLVIFGVFTHNLCTSHIVYSRLKEVEYHSHAIFSISSVSCRGTQCTQTFHIFSYCNAQTIVALPASFKKCAAISRHMSVILRWQSSSRSVCMHYTVSSNIVLGCPSCSLLRMFVLPSWNIDCHYWTFVRYFLLLKNEQYFASHNWRVECRSNSLLHKPNTYKTRWIHSKLFVQTDATILSTCPKCHHDSVTRMREKNKHYYFWSAPCNFE